MGAPATNQSAALSAPETGLRASGTFRASLSESCDTTMSISCALWGLQGMCQSKTAAQLFERTRGSMSTLLECS
jgi:hypothetical protein